MKNSTLFDLEGHNIVITGGGGVIAGALAEALVNAGAKVSLWGRSKSRPIEEAADLLAKYERGEKEGRILDPAFWPKRENKCFDYSGCEFLPLCSHPDNWEIYLRTYRQRRILYKEELNEMQR